jgi:signal transduction histidine kinase
MDITKRKTLSQIAFICVLVFVLMVAVLYLYNITGWGNQPDFGFARRTATGPAAVGILTEVGLKAGLQVGDRILKVNGEEFSNNREFNAARRMQPGINNTYLVERSNRQFEVIITNIPLGLKRVFIMSGLPFLAGVCYILIGTLVFLMKPHQRPSWIFFLFSAIFGLYITFLFKSGEMKPYWVNTLHIFLWTFSPAVSIHLGLSVPEGKNLIKQHPSVQLLPYFASILLFLSIRFITSEMIDAPKTLRLMLVIYLVAAILFFIGSCFQSWLTSRSEIVKLRSKMILLGAAIAASVPLLETFVNAVLHIFIVPSFNYYLPFFLAFPFFIGYSIVRHNLFDIDGTIRRTFGYIFVTIGIAIIYTFSIYIPPIFLAGFKFAESTIFPLGFTLVTVFLFNLAHGRIQSFIDQIFYRLEYNYEETVERISEKMRSLLTLDAIGRSILDIARNILFIDKGYVLVLNPKEQVYECLPSSSSFLKLPPHDPFIQKMAEKKKEVTRYDIEEDPLFEKEREACKNSFEQLEATLVMPMIYENHLIGLISLGNKKSGKFYRRLDINLLKTLANQGTLAVENVRLHEARVEVLEHSRKELEQLNRAKTIALDHLSHELITPLSIIKGTIQLMKRRILTQPSPITSEISFEMLEKQLNRLLEIQRETDSIIRSYREFEGKPVFLSSFAERVLNQVKQKAARRELHFHLEGEKDLYVFIPPGILEEILEGLLKNAIENTPDEGMIGVSFEKTDHEVLLKVEDFGVGITEENQKLIFGGLFHTQETDLYSSGRPYDFNAGGKGLDLLRIKVYGEHYGFDLSVKSRRCIFIPTNWDLCPGRISECPHCKSPEDCQSSGGSTFSISFPQPSEKPEQSG